MSASRGMPVTIDVAIGYGRSSELRLHFFSWGLLGAQGTPILRDR